MDIRALIPAADALPASPLFFQALTVLTFAVHLLFMNLLLGLTLIGLFRSLSPGPRAPALGQQASLVPLAAALAVNFGVAPLLFVQALYGQFFYVGATLMGAYWFLLVPVVMLAYALAYRQKAVLCRGEAKGVVLWALMSGCLLYVALMQTNNALLLVRPQLWAGYFTSPDGPGGTLLAWADPTLVPRWLHFVVASTAMGGLALAMLGHRRTRQGDPHGAELTRQGMVWFSRATLVQALDGLALLMTLPSEVLLPFMGGSTGPSALFMVGLTGVALSLLFGFQGRLMPAAASAVATVLAMVVLRETVRNLYLGPYFDVRALPVQPEPSTVVLFLSSFALALVVCWWAMKQPASDAKGA